MSGVIGSLLESLLNTPPSLTVWQAGVAAHVWLYDAYGIGEGASGAAAGLLHPFTPRGKLLWGGLEGYRATLHLINVADTARGAFPNPKRARGRSVLVLSVVRMVYFRSRWLLWVLGWAWLVGLNFLRRVI